MGIIVNLLVSTVSVLIAAYLLPEVYVESLAVAFVVAIVLGVLNVFVKPILKILTLPITVLTLGLFLIVINVLLVLLADFIIPGFSVGSYLSAFLFSLVVSLISSFLSKLA